MEEVPGRVSFKTQQKLLAYKNGKFFEQRYWTRANENFATRNKQSNHSSSCYESFDIPIHTMEFLSRSWSPSASNFLQTFSSSNNQELDFQENRSLEEHEEKEDHENDVLGEEEGIVQVDYAKADATQSNKNKIGTRILVERSIPSFLQSFTSLDINKRIKEWLREKSLTGILKWKQKEKKKKEVRLLKAKIHAALSVAKLAAAIAGFSATNSMEIAAKGASINEEMKMSNVIAYATALLASACAEAAESVGAHRVHVASAVNSGLATQSPADMITLTAAAATSLRGAETLKSSAISGLQFPGNKEAVKLAAKLPIITPSGQKVLRLVSIHLKHRQPMLNLEKKYLGVLTTSKDYTILQAIREKKAQGYYLLGIKCNGGGIKLLFEDKEQSLVWMANISNILQMCNS